MVKIGKIAKLLTYFNNDFIFYCSKTDKFLSTTGETYYSYSFESNSCKKIKINKEKDKGEYYTNIDELIPLFRYKNRDLLVDIENFIGNNKEKFVDFEQNKITVSKFRNFIEKNNLFDEWVEFFEASISFDVFYWCKDFNLREAEASYEQYAKIRKLFLDFISHHFSLEVSSQIIFDVDDDYDNFSFVVLGQEGPSEGISFILDGAGSGFFNVINSMDSFFIDTDLFNGLTHSLNLYYDDNEGRDFMKNCDINNPYGNDNLVSSIWCFTGNLFFSKLTCSAANLLIKYVNKATEYLLKFVNSKKIDELDDGDTYEIDCFTNDGECVFDIEKLEKLTYEKFPFEQIDGELSPVDGLHLIKGEYEFTVRRFPENIKTDDRREALYPFTILFLDCKTQRVVSFFVSKEDLFYNFNSLMNSIEDKKDELKIAKKIYVNNLYDFYFAHQLFEKYIDTNKMEIILVDGPLLVDGIFDSLDDYLSEPEDISKA